MPHLNFRPLRTQNQTELGSSKINRLIENSRSVVRGSIGLVVQYIARLDKENRDFIDYIAEKYNTTITDAFLWDICTSRQMLRRLFEKYPSVRKTLGAHDCEPYIASLCIIYDCLFSNKN